MGRAPCCDKNGLKKGPWTPEEDQKLVDYIRNHGSSNWRTLPKNSGLQRCGKSCRLRWTNYLRPDIKRGKFSLQEEETIIHLHSVLGNKWSAIASRLPGRTDNEIKNYWNTHIRKRLLRMGIDPVTHSPRLDLLDLSSIMSPSLYNHQYTNPNSQLGMARLLGLQQLVNPEILKFATTIFSNSLRPTTQNDPNSFCMQNQHAEETPSNFEIQNQVNFHTSHEQFVQTCHLQTTDCAASIQALEPISGSLDQFEPYSDMLDVGFDAQCYANFAGDLSNLLDTDVANQHNYVTSYYNSIYRSNDQSFSCGSVLSGSSSSPTPLNSNSNSTYITAEDERESYCSSFMKFEIPADPLDVNEFL